MGVGKRRYIYMEGEGGRRGLQWGDQVCYSREDEIGTERRSRFWQLGDGNREEGEAMRGDIVEELWRVCSWRF